MADIYVDAAAPLGLGDGSSPEDACTLAQAGNNDPILHTPIAAGVTVYCKATQTLEIDQSDYVILNENAGTADMPIRFVGYTDQLEDGGMFYISSSGNGGIFLTYQPYIEFHNFHCTGSQRAFWVTTSGQANLFNNCYASGCQFAGFFIQCNQTDTVVQNCTAENNGTGIYTNQTYLTIRNCVTRGNNSGIILDPSNTVPRTIQNCLCVDNNTVGIKCNSGVMLQNCTVHNNPQGILSTNAERSLIIADSIVSGSSGEGIATELGVIGVTATNCLLDPSDLPNGSKIGAGVNLYEQMPLTGNVAYTDLAGGDFSLSDTSAGRGASANLGGSFYTDSPYERDIGACQRSGGGGGGPSTTPHPLSNSTHPLGQ